MYSPTVSSRENELKSLKKLVGDDNKILDMVYEKVNEYKKRMTGNFTHHEQKFLTKLTVRSSLFKCMPKSCEKAKRMTDVMLAGALPILTALTILTI